MKTCARKSCKEEHPLSDYGKDKSRPDGLTPYCSKCRKEKGDKYYAERYANGKTRWYSYIRKYGLTQEGFEAIWAEQGECCAICKTTEPGGRGEFHVDHNHKTGDVRGILCTHCNTGLGKFGDSKERLIAALAYLESRGSYG